MRTQIPIEQVEVSAILKRCSRWPYERKLGGREIGPLFLWNLESSGDFAMGAGGIGEDIV